MRGDSLKASWYPEAMTNLLETEQDEVAGWLLAELAAQALAEHDAGDTEELDPETL